jgi:hypothetical protein
MFHVKQGKWILLLGILESAMGHPIPPGGMTPDQELQDPVIASRQAFRSRASAGPGGGEEEEPEGPVREKGPKPHIRNPMAVEESGKGIHPQSVAEEVGPEIGSGRALIPEQGEATLPIEMPQGATGDPRFERRTLEAGAKPLQQGLGSGLGHGPRGAQKGDVLRDKPASH